MTESQGWVALCWLAVIAVALEGWLAILMFGAAVFGLVVSLWLFWLLSRRQA